VTSAFTIGITNLNPNQPCTQVAGVVRVGFEPTTDMERLPLR